MIQLRAKPVEYLVDRTQRGLHITSKARPEERVTILGSLEKGVERDPVCSHTGLLYTERESFHAY